MIDVSRIGNGEIDELVRDFVLRNGLTLRTTHYKTHTSEIDPKSVAKAMMMWEKMGQPEGDIEINVPGFRGMTRLWGKKLGDRFDRNEVFYTRKRGEGRPFQDRLILRDRPLHATDIITIAIYSGGLETIYAGPALGPMPDAGKTNGDWANWKDHALAFTQSELDAMESLPNKLASKVASRYISKQADHHHGSYMSLQNVHEMYTFLDSIDNMIGHEGNIKELDDWVEDKISHAHALLQDLHRYFAYGRGYDSKAFESAQDYHDFEEKVRF